ncbi:MAG: hypothetical protein V3U25_00780 [Nitrososphaerales archaeon]
MQGYAEYPSINGPIYLREGEVSKRDAKFATIFDCDGVLVDAKLSYNLAIGRTVSLFFKETFQIDVKSTYVSEEIIYRFRASGGFNNDWDLTYSIILWILSRILRDAPDINDEIDPTDFKGSIEILRSLVSQKETEDASTEIIDSINSELLRLADSADSTGIASIVVKIPLRTELIKKITLLLGYPGDYQNSLLVRMFEEIYCGADLFQATYGTDPVFQTGDGLIKNEKIIVYESTLAKISGWVGRKSIGIASGRSLSSAQFTLKNLLNYFNPKAMFFIEDEERRENPQRLGSKLMDVGKPSPLSLLKTCIQMDESDFIFYIGDSMEDLIMAENARVFDKRIHFVGVYSTGLSSLETQTRMSGKGAYALIPSVNELPDLMATIGGM